MEIKSKTFIKSKADIEFLNYCKVNQLFPNFLNIRLYNRELQNSELTKDFKLKLLLNEIKELEMKNYNLKIETGRCLIDLKKSTGNFYFYSLIMFLTK